MDRCFSEYNRRFADTLGLPLRRAKIGPDSAVELILSNSWWPDMQWAGKKNHHQKSEN